MYPLVKTTTTTAASSLGMMNEMLEDDDEAYKQLLFFFFFFSSSPPPSSFSSSSGVQVVEVLEAEITTFEIFFGLVYSLLFKTKRVLFWKLTVQFPVQTHKQTNSQTIGSRERTNTHMKLGLEIWTNLPTFHTHSLGCLLVLLFWLFVSFLCHTHSLALLSIYIYNCSG